LGAQTGQIRPPSRPTGDLEVVLARWDGLLDGLPALLAEAAAAGFARRVLGPLATPSPETDSPRRLPAATADRRTGVGVPAAASRRGRGRGNTGVGYS
jgi:hypothetical protein